MLCFTKNLITSSFSYSLTESFQWAYCNIWHCPLQWLHFFLSVTLTREHSKTNLHMLFHLCLHDKQQMNLIDSKKKSSTGKSLIAFSMKNCSSFISRWLNRECTLVWTIGWQLMNCIVWVAWCIIQVWNQITFRIVTLNFNQILIPPSMAFHYYFVIVCFLVLKTIHMFMWRDSAIWKLIICPSWDHVKLGKKGAKRWSNIFSVKVT